MTASSSTAVSVTNLVRSIIAENGNKPMRLVKVFEEVSRRAPEAVRSKNYFKRHVVEQMFKRGELVKAHIQEDVGGKERDFYAMRLKVNGTNRRAVGAELLPLRSGAPSASAVASAAAAAAAVAGSAKAAAPVA